MPTINDLKAARLKVLTYTGALNEQEIKFFKANGATASDYNTAKQQWLNAKGATTGTLNERESKYLTSLGYVGTLNDKLLIALKANTYYA